MRLEERPEGRRLFDVLRPGDVLVVRWIDRLGRNYDDVTANVRRFMAMGIIVRTVINNMTFDGATTDPMQKAIRDALIAFMAATAQAQAEATKSAQQAGACKGTRHQIRRRGLQGPQTDVHAREPANGAGHARPARHDLGHRQGHRARPADDLPHRGRSGAGTSLAGGVGNAGSMTAAA
jgi:DNA invertase Pin-like site-specific DNA recombinase